MSRMVRVISYGLWCIALAYCTHRAFPNRWLVDLLVYLALMTPVALDVFVLTIAPATGRTGLQALEIDGNGHEECGA